MAYEIAEATAAITVNGTAAGYITVGDATPFKVGAICTIGNGVTGSKVQIVDLGAGNTIGVRIIPELGAPTATHIPQYRWEMALSGPTMGRSSATGFTTAFTLHQPKQAVNQVRSAP